MCFVNYYAVSQYLLRTQTRPIVTDRVAWSVGLSVGLWSVTLASPAKMAEPMEMSFGLRTRVGAGNHCIRWSPDTPKEGVSVLGKGPKESCVRWKSI